MKSKPELNLVQTKALKSFSTLLLNYQPGTKIFKAKGWFQNVAHPIDLISLINKKERNLSYLKEKSL
jgi:hypothetical protein